MASTSTITSTIKEMFGQEDIGKKYDNLSIMLTVPYVHQLIEKSGILQDVEKEAFILDVGTGTGALPLELCKHSNKWKVLATDFMEPMVKSALQKLEAQGFAHMVEGKVADATNLVDVADNSVDYAFGNFVYMIVPDQKKAFQELHRTLKVGGKAAFSVWTFLGYYEPLMNIFKKYSKKVPPMHVALSLSDEQKLRSLLEEAGFSNIKIVKGHGEWVETPQISTEKLLHFAGMFESEEIFAAARKEFESVVTEEYKHYEDKMAHFKTEAFVVVIEK